jgi:UDP-N-acetylglucosamine:LPS N-acetylglucosamine transferase
MVVELEAEEAAKKTVEDDDNPDWCNKMVAELEAKEAAEEAAKKAAEDSDNSNFDEDFWDKP